jgi:hypothetical protein
LGCSNVDEEKSNVDNATEVKQIDATTESYLYLFEIEGHQYIIYDGIYNGGIIHAEHCPCKNTNN